MRCRDRAMQRDYDATRRTAGTSLGDNLPLFPTAYYDRNMARGDDTNPSTPPLRGPSPLSGYPKPITLEQAFEAATRNYFDGVRGFSESVGYLDCIKYATRKVEMANPARLAAIEGIVDVNTSRGRKLAPDDPEHIERRERITDLYIDYLLALRQEFVDALTPEQMEAFDDYTDSLGWDEENFEPYK